MSFILHALGYGRSVFPHLLVILASTGATAPKSLHADAAAAAIVRVIAPQSRISVPRVKTATRAFDLGKGSSEHGNARASSRKPNPLKARQCTSKLNRTLLDVCYRMEWRKGWAGIHFLGRASSPDRAANVPCDPILGPVKAGFVASGAGVKMSRTAPDFSTTGVAPVNLTKGISPEKCLVSCKVQA